MVEYSVKTSFLEEVQQNSFPRVVCIETLLALEQLSVLIFSWWLLPSLDTLRALVHVDFTFTSFVADSVASMSFFGYSGSQA